MKRRGRGPCHARVGLAVIARPGEGFDDTFRVVGTVEKRVDAGTVLGQVFRDVIVHFALLPLILFPSMMKPEPKRSDSSANTIRPTRLIYPDGRELNYDYGSADSMADALSRVASLIDDDGTTHLADYSYLGLSTFVVKVSWPSAPSDAAKLLSDGEFVRVSTRPSDGNAESIGNT